MSDHAGFAAALLSAADQAPAGLKAWNGSDPARRFAVYRNNVIVSLIEALADTYPVTRQVIGAELFHSIARAYVRAQPPRSPILAFYGEGFGDHLRHTRATASLAHLPALAQLEWRYVRAFHAADAEPVEPEAIATLLNDEGSLPSLCFTLQPALQVLNSRYAVLSLWASHQRADAVDDIDLSMPESALIGRSGIEVQIRKIAHGTACFIACLQQGAALQAAATAAQEQDREFDLAASLGLLFQDRAITAVHTSKVPA